MPDPSANPLPVTLFYSYAHEDEPLRDELAGHLKILERRGLISAWHDRRIVAGQDWNQAIDQHLSNADLVLLLLSSDFIQSDYIFGTELTRTEERSQRGECEVVPIVVRAVDLQSDDFWFMSKQGLPPDLKPVTSWTNRDEAWTQVAKGLRKSVEAIRARRPAPPTPAFPASPPTATPPLSRDIDFGPRPIPRAFEAARGDGEGPKDLREPPGELLSGRNDAGSDPFAVGAGAVSSPAAPSDPQLDQLVASFVQNVDQAQQARGARPLYDHHRYMAEQEARKLIDLRDPARVLWVDDRPDNNRVERGLLAQLQIEVQCVTNSADALAALAQAAQDGEAFNLVISDWSRPADGARAGLDLLRRMRVGGLRLPFVLYHGEFDDRKRSQRDDEARAAGALGEAVMPAGLLALVQDGLTRGRS